MEEYFERVSGSVSMLTPESLVDGVAWRIYTEACMNPDEKFDPDTYNGEAFDKFIQDEMHFRGRSRDDILGALVRRAVDFRMRNPSCCLEHTNPDLWDENLRTNLEPYLPKPTSVAA